MKRVLSIFLSAVVILSLLVFPTVYADDYNDLCGLIAQSCNGNYQVNISRFGLNEDALDAAYVDTWYSGRLPWNVYSYRYTLNDGGMVLSFEPIYYDRAEYDYDRYAQAVAEVISNSVLEGMTQWQMALAVHDYLIVNSVYDESLEVNTNYDLLVNGTAVCSGYAMAYLDIMTRLGIECRFVESQAMAHAWNMVKIDGNWYHVDLTHDDPTPDSYGFVSHDHFLKTDKEMEQMGYHGWDNGITCTDERFINPLWKDALSTIHFPDVSSCYVRTKDQWDYRIEYISLEQPEKRSLLYTVPAKALKLEKDAYHYESNGLSLWGKRLWFSGVDRVWSMNPDGSDVKTELRYDIDSNKKFIYSSLVRDGTLYLTLSDGQYQFSPQVIALDNTAEHTHDYVETTVESTCLENGGIIYLCQCGLSYDGETLPPKGHTYECYISQQATCQESGEKTYVCADCGDSYLEAYTDEKAHSYESIIVKDASFFKEGQKHMTCQLCGFATYEALPRLSFQKHFGLTVWSTLSVIVLLAVMPILIISSRKRKK